MRIKNFIKKTKLYADGASYESMKKMNKVNYIDGFTTNPSLMRKSGIKDYKKFALKILKIIKKKSISFEVFSDDLKSMEIEAEKIASWGKNVYVKIPIQNTKGKSTTKLIKQLVKKKIKCNITAIFTLKQVLSVLKVIDKNSKIILSIFAGRIADTGVDPLPIMKEIVKKAKKYKNVKILWASTREVLNIFQSEQAGCHIITVPYNILHKLKLIGMNHDQLSKDTVKDFYNDAKASRFKI